MYEIWLMLNILWEIALTAWPLLALLLAVWLVLMALARRRMHAGWRMAVLVGVVGALLAFVLLPLLTGSSLSELAYWVDWVTLAGIAVGFGVASALFVLPLAGLLRDSMARR